MRRGDYATMLAERTRFGFKLFAGYVYPDDPRAGGMATIPVRANDRYTNALSGTQLARRNQVYDACFAQAVHEVTGRRVKSLEDLFQQHTDQTRAEARRTVDTDPQVIRLAEDYARCLRGEGYLVSSAAPAEVGSGASHVYLDQLEALGSRQNSGREGLLPELTPQQAQPYLNREIVAALQDLECGREFHPVYRARTSAIADRVAAEWGLDSW
ncbi:hypothetical protein [Nonomuraea endophytica]|uniref:hypothetical protein n=1 Tax=Nonomuraea endophytica TaxID=714136 RepID=UPI0037CAB67C